MRIAIIDLGTNTFNLLVAERAADGGLHILHSAERPVFLGKGGIEKGVIAEDAFARGMEALAAHREAALAHGAERILGFGTSALRNARNAPDFVREALDRFSIAITVVPGGEEAALILDGVRQAVPFGDRPHLVMDIGGGSIEFILATGSALLWKQSFELGVTRLRERFPAPDPLPADAELRIATHLDEHLGPLWTVTEHHRPHTLIGSAGSFDTLAAMLAAKTGRTLSDEEASLTFPLDAFDELKERLLRLPADERAQLPGIPPHRVETIPYAMIAVERVLAQGIRELCWSRYALKEGAAWRVLLGKA